MENPTEDQVQAMTNREFASLIRSQAEMIDRSIHRRDGPRPDAVRTEAEADSSSDDAKSSRRRQKQKV